MALSRGPPLSGGVSRNSEAFLPFRSEISSFDLEFLWLICCATEDRIDVFSSMSAGPPCRGLGPSDLAMVALASGHDGHGRPCPWPWPCLRGLCLGAPLDEQSVSNCGQSVAALLDLSDASVAIASAAREVCENSSSLLLPSSLDRSEGLPGGRVQAPLPPGLLPRVRLGRRKCPGGAVT